VLFSRVLPRFSDPAPYSTRGRWFECGFAENRGMSELRVTKPHGVALQAVGFERDNGRFRATATGLRRAALHAGGFCTKSGIVALQAGGLERYTTWPRDSELRHSPVCSL
jgi:hypothetical protein